MNQEHVVAARKAAADRMNAASKEWRDNPSDETYKAMRRAKDDYNNWVHTIVVRGSTTQCLNGTMVGEVIRDRR